MIKNFLLSLVLITSITARVAAQNGASSSASQTVQMVLYPVIDIDFEKTGSGNGELVNLAFNNSSSYANGVVSAGQQLRVRSNKDFKVSVQTDAANFSYQGPGSNNRVMPVNNTLSFAVTNNNSGGTVASAFDNNYSALSATSQDILLNGNSGGEQTFTVAYKANPDYKYPAGVYTIGVVYTATQP